MSVSGYFRGTPGYMPPEQVFLWPDTGVSSDLFSLGVMLFEMLTGLMPYGDNWRIAPANALEENMAPHPAGPDGLWEIVKCAIHPLPSQRYRSTRAMRVAIEEFSGKRQLPTQLGIHQLVASAPGRKAWATTVSVNATKPHQIINIPILKEQDSPEGSTPLHEANLATADIP